jgi:hypothetical protein
MDARRADEYYGARVAPVAQLDRVLPSEGRGHGFESRQVHHLLPFASQGVSVTPHTCFSPECRTPIDRGIFVSRVEAVGTAFHQLIIAASPKSH